jgi:hypothetical protein
MIGHPAPYNRTGTSADLIEPWGSGMELDRLIDALRDPGAYPFRVADVQVCQTHISVVFLAGDFAY